MELAEFEHAYRTHAKAVYRYCAFRTNSAAAAEDLTADVFVELLRSGRPPAEEYLLRWLYRVAQRTCARHRARSAREAVLFTEPPERGCDEAPWSDPLVWRVVAGLPSAQQLVVFLRVVEDLPFDRVARIAGRRVGATKMLFYRAMRSLRDALPQEVM